MVSYKESITEKNRQSKQLNKLINNRPIFAELDLEIEPSDSGENEVVFGFAREKTFDMEYAEYKKKIY